MAWEYLEDMDFRYKDAVALLGDTSEKDVVELNCGNGRLKDYMKHKTYRGNDLLKEDDENYSSLPDDKFIETVDKCDILCCFGFGGYELSNQPLESKTITNSVIKLINKFNPVLILEAVDRYLPLIDKVKEATGYITRVARHYDLGDGFVYKRTLKILEKN